MEGEPGPTRPTQNTAKRGSAPTHVCGWTESPLMNHKCAVVDVPFDAELNYSDYKLEKNHQEIYY